MQNIYYLTCWIQQKFDKVSDIKIIISNFTSQISYSSLALTYPPHHDVQTYVLVLSYKILCYVWVVSFLFCDCSSENENETTVSYLLGTLTLALVQMNKTYIICASHILEISFFFISLDFRNKDVYFTFLVLLFVLAGCK